jgi:putative tryptophan/tyrosine transport system substrate-binding protein
MRRREFIGGVGGAILGLPSLSYGQQVKSKRVGIVLQGGPHRLGVAGLREGLKAAGLEEGAQLSFVIREGGGNLGNITTAAKELEAERVDLIVAFSTSVALAAKQATTNVPIVFAAGSDPVVFGLVDSIARPGGRLTGVHSIIADVASKRFELLLEIAPTVRRVISFYNPDNPVAKSAIAQAGVAARALSVELIERPVKSPEQLRESINALKAGEADGIFFVNDAMVLSHDELIVERARDLRMATMAYELNLVSTGALAGYGLNYRELGRLAAIYVHRILAGTHPSALPVEAIPKPAFAINLRTAKVLGITVPVSVLLRADDVIE